jgi:hypothetical protein
VIAHRDRAKDHSRSLTSYGNGTVKQKCECKAFSEQDMNDDKTWYNLDAGIELTEHKPTEMNK